MVLLTASGLIFSIIPQVALKDINPQVDYGEKKPPSGVFYGEKNRPKEKIPRRALSFFTISNKQSKTES